MDIRGIDRRRRKWHNLKQKLGRTAMGCCGGAWPPKSSTIIDILAQPQDDEEQAITSNMITAIPIESEESSATRLLAAAPASTGMNLAMALAAERNLRAAPAVEEAKTLKRVIEETEGEWRRGSGEEGGRGGDWVCCVCMERKKGAAFIPCGHAFCRVCSGEVWFTRASCPLCNRSILDILQIF